jgi:hypothetical protein
MVKFFLHYNTLPQMVCPVLNKLTLLKSKSVSVCETIVE